MCRVELTLVDIRDRRLRRYLAYAGLVVLALACVAVVVQAMGAPGWQVPVEIPQNGFGKK
jgi:hypothetical protein